MLLTPLGLFAVAAVAGLIMAFRIFAGSAPPWILTVLHGAFGAAGLVTLGLAVLEAPGNTLVTASLAILVAAALGGFYLVTFHLRGAEHPKPVIALHALLAVAGVGLLAGVAMGVI